MKPVFANAWVLYFLWIIPVLAVWWHAVLTRRENALSAFISPAMQEKLRPASSRQLEVWQMILVISGLLLMLIALARPQWGTGEVKVFQRGRDLVVTLDVSRSMLADDVHPNRLLRAKADIMDLVRELKGDRAALIAFRHKAILRCPLTTDYAYFLQSLDAITIDSAPVGETDIGDAILKSLDAFDAESGSHKAIILISDGEDLSGKALDAAEEAGKRNIPIFTVGIGSRDGSKIRDQENKTIFIKHDGSEVVTKLDHNTLYSIAKKSGGAYIPVETTTMDLGTLYQNHLKQIAAHEQEETLQRRHIERYQLFLLPGLLLILAACFLSRGRLAVRPAPDRGAPDKKGSGLINSTTIKSGAGSSAIKQIALIVVSAGVALHSCPAQTNNAPDPALPQGREGARVAQKLFKSGAYDAASEAYLKAAGEAPESASRDFRYNAALALYRAGKFEEASEILRELSQTEPTPSAKTTMALGSSLYRNAGTGERDNPTNVIARAQLLKEAGEVFKDATRAQSKDNDAGHNLAVILRQLPDARNEAKIAELTEKYQDTQAGEIAYELLNNQRVITSTMPDILDDSSPDQIRKFEDIARLQKENSDLWIPLKEKMLTAIAGQAQQQGSSTNVQQQLTQVHQYISAIQSEMKHASNQLRDLDPAGHNTALASQAGVYHLWKVVAPYNLILSEDLRAQSNLISETSQNMQSDSTVAAQEEAAGLTQLFVERFEQSVPEASPPETVESDDQNQPGGMSAGDRQKIIGHAEMAVTAQQNAARLLKDRAIADSLAEQQRAYELLKEIEKLLPKDNQQNQQQQDQKDQDEKDQQSDQNQEQQEQQQEQEKQQNQADEKEQEQPQKDEKESSPAEIRKLIEKALDREKEHEAEKQRRNRNIPMSTGTRDW